MVRKHGVSLTVRALFTCWSQHRGMARMNEGTRKCRYIVSSRLTPVRLLQTLFEWHEDTRTLSQYFWPSPGTGNLFALHFIFAENYQIIQRVRGPTFLTLTSPVCRSIFYSVEYFTTKICP
ncbi:hypothetical protein RvY_03963-1 [Ramazzottius varieornatus]|uniref:Uncharacterized protein n=1 Tax=Ramazzottius varieornatus TaxID=947166 RepID=A0A1D1UZZ9_RAMVA|nr:hypothetical protein RvY_03963-1 [Ramazzottius varieornatus]